MSSKGVTTSLLFTFLIGLFLCGCGKIKGPSFPVIASPRVIVTTPSSPASGDIIITFQLIDRELEQGDVTVEYSTDDRQTFTTATLTATSQATSLASDWYPGIEHTIQWDSVSDMVGRSGDASVCIRITASDATNPLGNAGISGTFTINNLAFNGRPGATLDTPTGVQHGSVQITYTLTDTEGNTCSIVAAFSTDSGTTWATVTMGPGGDGLTGLASSPAGTQHVFFWDSLADGVGLTAQQNNVKVRITPTDFNQGTAGETGVFSVDNTIIADFSASPVSGYAPLLVSFTDLSTSNLGITSWSWDFGDGDTSGAQNPGHTYDSKGTYTVSLTVTGPDGSCTETKADCVTVLGPPTVTGITPAPGAVLLDTPPEGVVITFSNEIDSSTVSSDTFKLVASGGDGRFNDGNETEVTLTSITRTATNQVTIDLTGVSLPDDTYQVTVVGQHAGYALSLDGSDDYVPVGTSGMPPINAPQSICFWYWVSTNTTGRESIVALMRSSSSVQVGFIDSEFMVWKYFIGQLARTIPPPAGVWHYIAYTFDGTNHRLYIDGTEVAGSTNSPDSGNPSSVEFGRTEGWGEYYQGLLDEVSIWSVPLTQQQIQTQIASGLSGSESGLVGYWKFDEGSGQVVADSSPLGNHGTRGANSSVGSDDPVWVASTAPIPGGVKDFYGYFLDGEFSGSFPSGDGNEGGNFVSTFVVSKRPIMDSIIPDHGESGDNLIVVTITGANFNEGNNPLPSGAVAFGGHYYIFVNDAKTWHEAKADCETRGGHLATISSAAENQFVHNLGASTWLGGTDEGHEGTWVWITGEPMTYINWNSGEPNNTGGTEHYIEYSSGSLAWNDDSSFVAKPYVCEFDEWTSPAVHLSMSGQADIVATDVRFIDSRNLTFDIDLTGAALGAWDIVVTNPDGGSATLPGGFTVINPQPPVADFSADRTTGPVSLAVYFTDTSTGIVTSWLWDFGDGGTGTEQNSFHYYNAVGTYTVSLSISGPGGSDTLTRIGYMTVTERPPSGHYNSGWPVRGQNEQRTSCSPVFGPQTNRVLRTYQMGWGFGYFAPSIGKDGVIYSGCWDNDLHAFNPGGTIKWKYSGKGNLSPCVALDGTVYWGGSGSKNLVALDPVDGSEKWYYNVGGTPGLCPSPVIGTDGTVYVASGDGGVYAINPSGSLKWRFETGSNVEGWPALATDGTIYAGNDGGILFAINPNGTEKWRHTDTSAIQTDIVVADDGTIYYCAGGALTALNPSGSFKWSVPGTGAQRPSIAPDGTIVACKGGQGYIAINPGGTERWRHHVDRNTLAKAAIGADGTVYGGTWDSHVRALDIENGSLKWSCDTGGWIEGSPMIGADGTLYIGSNSGRMYAFRDISPNANYSALPLTGTRPLLVNFTDASTGTITEWLWVFGDGQTSTEQNPSHTYTKAGTYTVSLSVKGPSGATAKTMKDYVTVTE